MLLLLDGKAYVSSEGGTHWGTGVAGWEDNADADDHGEGKDEMPVGTDTDALRGGQGNGEGRVMVSSISKSIMPGV